MDDPAHQRFAAALFRMIVARIAAPAVGVFALEGGGCRLWAGTPGLCSEWGATGRGVPLAPEVARALACGKAARIAPRSLGLGGGFAAIAAVPGRSGAAAGFLLALDRRPRRLTPAVTTALADGATLVTPLLAAEATAARPRQTPQPRKAAEHIVEAALRDRAADGPFALMLLDLDRFRSVNAALGFAAGDALLAVTGARLRHALGSEDRLERLEGDRFMVLATGARPELCALAQRLLDAVGQPLDLAGRTVAMQASIGIVAGIPRGLPMATLLLQADTALARAKAEGRNRFVLREPRLEAAVLEKSRLELDLAHALGRNQLHMVYQPYIALADDTVSGAEALLRWRHPARGELPPAAFIPLAEATGLILPIGNWALATALAQAARWPKQLAVSVNVSALQFREPGFVAEVDAALAAAGVAPGRLELEITETVLMRDNPETTRQLRALIDRGVRIALDDFGTGYSALAYLARLPHHRIKLDKAFVHDLANPATAELIRAIIALARARGIEVTAEGVERPGLLAEVRRLGFTHAQGYATGAPAASPAAIRAPAEAPALARA